MWGGFAACFVGFRSCLQAMTLIVASVDSCEEDY